MVKRTILYLLLLLLAGNNSAYAEAWNFAVFSDTQGTSGSSGVRTDVVTQIANDIVNNRDCAFVLISGDLINGETGGSDLPLSSQHQTFKNALTAAGFKVAGSSGSGIPYYPVRGNHDTYNTTWGTDAVADWRDKFGTLPQNGPTTASGGGGNSEVGLTYSFTYDNALFFALDEYANTWHTVNQDWVDEQLAANTYQHVFAFGHEAAYQLGHSSILAAEQAARDDFLTSFYNAGGKFYFCGHDHVIAIARVYEKDPAAGGTQGLYQIADGRGGGSARSFYGNYNNDYPGDYSVSDLYHDSDPDLSIPSYRSYILVTVDGDLLLLRAYGAETATPTNFNLAYALVAGGTWETNAETLTCGLGNDATVVFNQTTDATYSGLIKGTGTLVKNGAGTLTLSANNQYTGATTVNAGTLKITGESFLTPVTVNTGGVLTGDGIIKSLTNYGIVRPGNSVGTLHLDGNVFTQGTSGTLEIEVASTSSYDKIVSITTADLRGTLKTITAGSYSIGDTLSGVVNTWDDVTFNFSFLDTPITPTIVWKPQKNGNNLDLVAARDYNNDALKVALTPNQRSIAALAESLFPSASGDLAAVKTAVDSMNTTAEVAEAYSQMSGEALNGVASITLSGLNTQLNNLQSQMQTLRTGAGGMAFNPNSGTLRGDLFNGVLLAYEGDDWGKFVPRSDADAKEEGSLGFFINAQGSFADQEATDSQPGFHCSSGGVTSGWDYRFWENLVAGFNIGYTYTLSHLGGSAGEVDVGSTSYGLYGTYFGNNFYVDAAGGFCFNSYDTKRDIVFGGLDRKAKADTSGKQWDLFLGTGYDLHLRRVTTGPTATLKYAKLWIDGFSETGADALNLNIVEQKTDSLQLGLGWRAECELKFGRKGLLVPRAHVSYQHEFLSESRSIEARLAQGGDVFQVTTDKPSRDFALLGCGFSARLTGSTFLNFGYQAEAGRNNYFAQSVEGGISLYF